MRAALYARIGSRGGVARIYRLLDAERASIAQSVPSSTGSRLLEVENQTLRERLKVAMQREDAHQTYWSREITALRRRIEGLEERINQSPSAQGLKAEVQAAETRAGQLEVGLRAFGPAAHRR